MIYMNTKQDNPEVLQRAISHLEKCEGEIYSLVGEAAKSRDSSSVDSLNQLAQQLGELREAMVEGETAQVETAVMQKALPRETRKPLQESRSTKRRRTARPDGYPRFSTEGNSLIKTSWSKTKNSEYMHKAPKRVLDKLIEVMLELGGDGDVISTDQMFPLEDGGDQFPDYQSYLCLLWLKQEKLLIHRGREGYEIRDLETFANECDKLWQDLDA